ncbi:MAG: class I tRNA ligase family protein [Chthoniobacterales bacterium]
MSKEVFYITTAIDYTNAAPHIGHAYEKVLADTIARYQRLCGKEVFFLTGVDQHGQKVKQAAEQKGVEPQAFADSVTEKFLDLWKQLGVVYDGWAATTDPRHKRVVREILQSLHDKGLLYKAKHKGHYSVRQEQFLTDKERDESGNFGPEWGEVQEIEEENWYFKLSEYRDWFVNFLNTHPDFITPSFRIAEVANAVAKNSADLCISRPKARLSWGIEFPFDPEFVTYVWFDALINYISFAGYLPKEGEGFPKFEKVWPCDAHVIGKDILVPAHGIYWPAMLKAIGFEDHEIPKLLVHGWWNLRGAKISKSQGNIIDPKLLAEQYGTDALRYYLMRDIVMGQDADFSEERLILRYNTELANGLGNLLNRSLNMAQRYRQGVLQPVGDGHADIEAERAANREAVAVYRKAMDAYQLHIALDAIGNIITRANAFVETTAPWKLAKDEAQASRLDAVLSYLAESVRLAATLLSPVIPEAATRIFEQLGLSAIAICVEPVCPALEATHKTGAAQPVFPRIETPETNG